MKNIFTSSVLAVVLGCSVLASGLKAAAIADADRQLQSSSMELRVSTTQPGIESLDIDGLGLGKRGANIMRASVAAQSGGYDVSALTVGAGKEVDYRRTGRPGDEAPAWSIQFSDKQIKLISQWSDGENPQPLSLVMNTAACHTTLLGVFNANGGIGLPALMHLPGEGDIRVSATAAQTVAVGYTNGGNKSTTLTLTFPAAIAGVPRVEYQLDVTAIYPQLPGIENDPRFDSFKRNWLNALQLNPGHRELSNNTTSTSCAFCYYEYADIAAKTPPLADGLTALDTVRETLDTIFAGSHAYGMPSRGNFPVTSSDTYPSMLIAAEDVVQGGKSDAWLAANYAGLKGWADKMLATDTNGGDPIPAWITPAQAAKMFSPGTDGGDGLFKYAISGNSGIWPEGFRAPLLRPSNWWDTIGFGHEDAYGNALAYRALQGMEDMARRVGKRDDAGRYHAAAEKLKAAYFDRFYNPATGVLGGWRSSDGELHDYYFMWVSGIAIDYGLVPKDKANKIMDAMMAKLKEVGYTHFNMGLPGNLITVPLKDYVHKAADGHFGGGVREDNADGFQKYENGGATGDFAYFTLAALYDLGRKEEADQILFPMLGEYDKGGFEGRRAGGRSNDWRMWDGTPMGYEGFLVDNYYTLLAVPLRQSEP